MQLLIIICHWGDQSIKFFLADYFFVTRLVQGQADEYYLHTYFLLSQFSSLHVAFLTVLGVERGHAEVPLTPSNNCLV